MILICGIDLCIYMRRLFIVTTKKHQNIPKYTGMSPMATSFFLDNSSTDFKTIRRHFMRQLDDTFILSEALEEFLRTLAKNLKGYKENHKPIINRLKQWIFGKFGRIPFGYSF